MRTKAVAEQVVRAVGMIRVRLMQSELSLVIEPCPELAVHADPDRLQQVLRNLLTNAIKFTPLTGRFR